MYWIPHRHFCEAAFIQSYMNKPYIYIYIYKIDIKYLIAMYVGAINELVCAFLGEHFIFS